MYVIFLNFHLHIVEESLRGQNSKKKNKDMKDQVTVKVNSILGVE